MRSVRGIRGATTVEANTKAAILAATREMLSELTSANDLDIGDVAAAYFTTTDDLNAEFPAVAARQLGWDNVALMCGHEMKVPDAVTRCIRVMLLVNTEKSAADLANVYLGGATDLKKRGMERENQS
jgi:chorismate mutase